MTRYTARDGEPAELARELPELGPWRPLALDLPPGPRWFEGRGAYGWAGSPDRVAKERAGIERLGQFPARPIVVAATERAIALAPFGEKREPDLDAWPVERAHVEGTRRQLLSDPEINVARALVRAGVRRKHADRWLGARVSFETEVGLTFGGVDPRWFRAAGDGVVCVRCDRVRVGWRALDRAGLALDLARAVPDGDEALELALVLVWLREHERSGTKEYAERVRAIVEPRAEPERVRVWIDAPPFVDASVWAAPGEDVSASRARWLASELDGLVVGGRAISVRVEPRVRVGKRGPPREDRALRRRRTFSRWDEGIRADDEGLLSATPEALALRLAADLRGVVIDGTCGIGSIAIACARTPGVERVIAVDVDRDRLDMARHNASIYGVADRIDFVCDDLGRVIDRLRGGALVLDPPWGGRDYDRARVALSDLGMDVARILERFSGRVVLKLPRSFDPSTLPGDGWALEALIDDRGIVKLLLARRG